MQTRRGTTTAALAAALLATACAAGGVRQAGLADSAGAPRSAAAPEGLDDARFAIARTITDTARAVSDFPRTSDPKSVLRFYAADYDGVQDGDRQTLKDVERLLDELRERIAGGAPIQMAARTTNIRVEMETPTLGWASYDLMFAIGAGNRAVQQFARCTGLYRKQGDAWLVRHEHCSTRRPSRVPG